MAGETWFTGSMDIHMINQAGCSYCNGGSGGNTESVCTGSGGTWSFDASMDLATCTSNYGVYFDGNIYGFQFVLTSESMTIADNSIVGGSSVDLNYTIIINPDYADDVDNDGTADIVGTMILGYSSSQTPIHPGDGALITIAFTDYADDPICFTEQYCSSGACINEMIGISNGGAFVVEADWGDCNCVGGVCDDCAGTPNGDAELDNCGICDNDPSNDCVQDCTGTWGGEAELDECGVCDGDGIPDGECDCDGNVEDCAGVCDGNAVVDDCGVCDGGNADMDCAGECFGESALDECGVCGGDGIPDGECDCDGNVEDCAGVCDGDSVVDEGGECVTPSCDAALGDANGDGIINILDILQLVNCILNGNCASVGCGGDINEDGVYDIFDVVGLVNIILGN